MPALDPQPAVRQVLDQVQRQVIDVDQQSQPQYVLAHQVHLGGAVQRDRSGFISAGDDTPAAALSDNNWAALGRHPHLLESSLPGVFAVGDVRANSVKRVAAAVGEGSMAVRLVQQYLGKVG
ncbi:MAG TPA: hypothetical protein VIY52_19865 [Streptosporangiaceae bacterium]